LIFAVLSVVAITASRLWLRRHPITTDDSTLNRRGSQYVGRVVTLDQPLVDGAGKVRIGDTFWRVATPDNSDLAAGVQVRITGVDGIVLKIEPVQPDA
ncbi:MAG: NfeD family protein, partial [Alphaproteobacteria bacterium]|nr:NfeD family protein [Alphaproteobacteria bacterium]